SAWWFVRRGLQKTRHLDVGSECPSASSRVQSGEPRLSGPIRRIDGLTCRIALVVFRSTAGLHFLVGREVAGGDLDYIMVGIAVVQARARAVIHCPKRRDAGCSQPPISLL